MKAHVNLIVLGLLSTAACMGDDEVLPELALDSDARALDGAGPRPDATPDAASGPRLRAEGTATAPGEGDERVECSFFLDVEHVVETTTGWTGDAFGEVFRRSLDGAAPLFEFSALVAGQVSLVATKGGVAVRLVGDQPEDARPFWLALETIAGTSTGDLTAAGVWTCAPILPGDPGTNDLEVDAPGTWTIGPLP